ncbi:MAG: hypothetical protein NTY87_10680 [Planctomycetia bacterium]|nr:hypothetical protein [Planctomycetia bacterium]
MTGVPPATPSPSASGRSAWDTPVPWRRRPIRLVRKMDAVKEGEGTLLDNTMFLLGSGLGSGELHEPTNLPTVLAGGGGTLRTGRHVQYSPGTPIANLWLTMAKIMGLPSDRIGDSTGPLDGIVT